MPDRARARWGAGRGRAAEAGAARGATRRDVLRMEGRLTRKAGSGAADDSDDDSDSKPALAVAGSGAEPSG